MLTKLKYRLACLFFGHAWFPEDIRVLPCGHHITFTYKCAVCEAVREYER